jgi:hypothetical protein
MSLLKFLTAEPMHEIVALKKSGESKKDCLSFSGAPRKHPYDNEKILLIQDPFDGTDSVFYEFKLKDLVEVEDEPRITTPGGEILRIVKLYVRKGSYGLRYQPFEVNDEITFLKDKDIFSANP